MSSDQRNRKPAPAQLNFFDTDSDPGPLPFQPHRGPAVILARSGAKGGRVTLQCVMCGTPFEAFRSVADKYVTCSKVCAIAHLKAFPRKPKTGVEYPCVVCGKPFWRIKARETSVLCSAECRVIYTTRRREKPCGYCGKVMVLPPSRSNYNFCSYECRALGLIKRPLDRTHNGRPARMDQHGYVMVWEPDHPNRSLKGWQYEHRLVTEKSIGRYLASEEVIHHRDGCKSNNDPANLEIMDAKEHAALSSRDQSDLIARSLARLAEYERRFGPLPDSDPEP
jgi:endogenous inhibitor of DNA gyrase (YacG/DUF329 family)